MQPVWRKLRHIVDPLSDEMPMTEFLLTFINAIGRVVNYMDYVGRHPRPVLKMASFADFIYNAFGVLAALDDDAAYNRVVALTNEMLQAL